MNKQICTINNLSDVIHQEEGRSGCYLYVSPHDGSISIETQPPTAIIEWLVNRRLRPVRQEEKLKEWACRQRFRVGVTVRPQSV